MTNIELEQVDPSRLLAVTGGQVRAPAVSNQPIVWRNGYASEQPQLGPSFPSGPSYRTNPYTNPQTQYFDHPARPKPVWKR
ncbi:MAG TPA: hypothetical protein VIV11_31620 [Kofleriaceae bacterium]